MSKYEYSSYSSSSKGAADTSGLFAQIDTDGDGVIDRSELANFVGGSSTRRVGGRYGSSTYESSGYSSGIGHEGSSHSGRYHSSLYESGSGLDASTLEIAANYTADSNPVWSRYGADVRGVGLYYDPNPEIIRREVPGGVQTYTQNIRIRFFQPPPAPPPGPLIIKEVRPAQPPPLPPLRIKQHEIAVAELPPLILRERPPLPPPALPSETQIRHLPALPVPPRSVIIERYSAGAVRPRDIIIERWLPYSSSAYERKTIVQRADAVQDYPPPRNVIIQYEAGSARVVRQFQQLGVVKENPQAYIDRYGGELLDTQTLLQQARAAGVFEDISVPAGITSAGYSSVQLRTDGSYVGGETSLVGVSSEDLGGASSLYSTNVYDSSSVGGTGGLVTVGYESGFGREGGSGFKSSKYESTSYSSGGGTGFHTTNEAEL